ncbi:uncharacterized protein LOC133831810 isoform X2 [Humulus lupulus]|nr:uncharacterized protein LOC133831810 isoform X2 [Humulus lupulus]XP_062118214.1 uncharacterized protein LOC133831810 isoform X2 [Humulus lupulus]XP_062118219.1 uncharacterized protein LOC133831810 isoform X2 [Humulus lupulus]
MIDLELSVGHSKVLLTLQLLYFIGDKPSSSAKRVKREHADARLREKLKKGKWLWSLQELSFVLLLPDSEDAISSSSSSLNEESSILNEHMVVLLPGAVYALSVGYKVFGDLS